MECEEFSAAYFKASPCPSFCLDQACSLHLFALKVFSHIALALNIAGRIYAAGNHSTGH